MVKMGQKFAAFDDLGVITAFYDSEDSPPPVTARVIEISMDEWHSCLREPGSLVVAGGQLVPAATPPDAELLAAAVQAKLVELDAACRDVILNGFQSDALGAEYTYPTKLTDQQNLIASVVDSLLAQGADWTTPFWCQASDGTWSFRPHTIEQIQQAGRDGKAAILDAMAKCAVLSERARAAVSTNELLDISW